MPTSSTAKTGVTPMKTRNTSLEEELQRQKLVQPLPNKSGDQRSGDSVIEHSSDTEKDVSLISGKEKSAPKRKACSKPKDSKKKKKEKAIQSSSDESSSDTEDSDLSFSALGCGLSDVEFVSTSESDTLDEIVEFWRDLPLDLYSVPREGGERWKRVIEKAMKLSKKLKKIIKGLKAKKSKEHGQVRKDMKADIDMLKLGFAQFEKFQDTFGPTSTFVSTFTFSMSIIDSLYSFF